MKTPYYAGEFTATQHHGGDNEDELRERMLEHRLANRDDVRDIYVVTALPRFRDSGTSMAKKFSDKTDLTPLMHWAVQVGDQYFELQKAYPDPLRTGLRVSTWDEKKQSQVIERHRQGATAMTDNEIKTVGEKYFSRLERIDINVYDVWCNNCQSAVDCMLRDIGGLSYYRKRFKSIREMVKQFFYNRVIDVTKLYGRYRGWNEDIIAGYTELLHRTLRVMIDRQEYPKEHWIREDIDSAEGSLKKVGTVADHWLLTVLESSLSLKKGSEELYVQRGADGKAELNFENLKKATKGIFDEGENSRLSWLKAMPWLTAGFLVGTPKWAAAVISIALSRAKELYEDHQGLKGGMEASLTGLGVSPKVQNDIWVSTTRAGRRGRRQMTTGQRRVRSKILSVDHQLIARYERFISAAGVPYYIDHANKTRSWDAPDQQEMCIKIVDPPLSRRWEVRQEEDRIIYVNCVTEEISETRPGLAEIWVIKKKIKPDWIKSTMMALPHGWEMRRTDEGELFYLDHSDDHATPATTHPMRQEIEGERRNLLPEWNVEWDNARGKKYRKIMTGEIRWKAVDGPRFNPAGDKSKIARKKSQDGFTEPLPPGWTVTDRENGLKVYSNGKLGKERLERTNHPLSDKRRRLQSEWEMRYTPGGTRYWIHWGNDGRGSAWWTRNKLLKNISLQNNASGWKLAKNGQDWEWFEGGDVPHSEIPVLDLDDPAEGEFREYPFVLPPRITDEDGEFIEPLPPNWVRRTHEDGSQYYWNFKDEARWEEHPNEEERRNLHALWSMRFTRHGRQYFIHHEDGSTWWTHPREDKHRQIPRARPGQKQNGWKIGEDGRTWERFEDQPDAQSTEDNLNALAPTKSADSATSLADRNPASSRSSSDPRKWLKSISSSDSNPREWLKSVHSSESNPREWLKSVNSSESNPREWLKNVNSSDRVVNARANLAKRPTLLKKFSKPPDTNSNTSPNFTAAESPQDVVEGEKEDQAQEKWLEDASKMTAEAELTEDPEQITTVPSEATKEDSAPDSLTTSSQNKLLTESPSQDALVAATEPHMKDPTLKEESKSSTTPQTPWSAESSSADTPQSDQTTTPASTPPTPMFEAPKALYSRVKDTRKGWTKRTTSQFSAMKEKHKGRFGNRVGSDAPAEKVASAYDVKPTIDGLGITGAEDTLDAGGQVEMLSPIPEKVEGRETKNSVERPSEETSSTKQQSEEATC